MKSRIICKNTIKGEHSFYLNVNNRDYFLFSQDYRSCVRQYFGLGGLLLDKVMGENHYNQVVGRTIHRVIQAVKDFEKEYSIIVLEKTAKKFYHKPGIRYARMEERLKGYEKVDEFYA